MVTRNGAILILYPLLLLYSIYRIIEINEIKNILSINPTSENEKQTCSVEYFIKNMENYRECLVNSIRMADIWTNLESTIHRCLGRKRLRWRMSNLHQLRNKDDVKFVILPNSLDSTSCVHVTLGIGGDIRAEQKLLGLLPQCKLFGADPIPSSGQIFADIGKYFRLAVGDKSGQIKASVLSNGTYRVETVETKEFKIFVKEYVKMDLIDYLWMDNEGAEYGIFQKYLKGDDGFTICQITVEMHSPSEEYSMNRTAFNDLMFSFISRSHFLPIWSRVHGLHTRAFYINVVDPVCIHKYFLYRFCEESERV